MPPRLASALQGLMDDYNELDFLPSLLAKLLSELAGFYANIPLQLRMISGEIAILTTKLVILSQRMHSADLSLFFDDVKMLIKPLKHLSVHLSQMVAALLAGPQRKGMNHKMDILSDNQRPFYSKTNFKQA